MQKPHVLALLETHISGTRADAVREHIGLEGRFRMKAQRFQGGIWIFWDSSEVHMTVMEAHR